MPSSSSGPRRQHQFEAVPSSQLTPPPSATPSVGTSDASSPAIATVLSKQNVDGARKRHQAKDRFRYGNFNRYYGVRNQGFDHDPRVDLFPVHWFRGRHVLDIGCNVGHLTLEIAKKLAPAFILGIDIDEHLVGVARKNIRHYCDGTQKLIGGKFPASLLPTATSPTTGDEQQQHDDECSTTTATTTIVDAEGEKDTAPSVVGQIDAKSSNNNLAVAPPPSTAAIFQHGQQFPKNVWFLRENYVLESDEFLEMVREEYDVVLALSITKWVHLNWGDVGLKRFLRRTFLNLRPGGHLLLEAQPFSTYYKKAKMTPDMFETYKSIQFKPHQFKDFLLSDMVGFSECEELGTPSAISKGFERPILVFKKGAAVARKRTKAQHLPQPTKAPNIADNKPETMTK